jgi:hypothetical protein
MDDCRLIVFERMSCSGVGLLDLRLQSGRPVIICGDGEVERFMCFPFVLYRNGCYRSDGACK